MMVEVCVHVYLHLHLYIDDKDASSTSKSSVVMDKNIMMSPPPQHPRKKIDLGECSRSAQVFKTPKGQAQAHT